jgi:hypothetical protein
LIITPATKYINSFCCTAWIPAFAGMTILTYLIADVIIKHGLFSPTGVFVIGLSASRFARMAAAVLQGKYLLHIVSEYKPYLL